MCETCGVTLAQYDRARWLLAQASWAALYRNVGRDPALMGVELLTDAQVAFINDSLTAYYPMHRDLGEATAADEFRECFARREIERAAAVEAATLAGC